MNTRTHRVLSWDFPLPRTHTGVVLGNGRQGAMVWGENRLCLTVSRAGFWDRRGGVPFDHRATFEEVRALLEAGDETGVRRIFAEPQMPGNPPRPYQLGGGRFELEFGSGVRPRRATLALRRGVLTVEMERTDGSFFPLRIRQSMSDELLWLEWEAALSSLSRVHFLPAYEFVRQTLEAWGVQPPELHQTAEGGLMVQRFPADEALAIAWKIMPGRMVIATALGSEPAESARARLSGADLQQEERRSDRWWRVYWNDVPSVRLPDAVLQRAWLYGLYRQAGLTTPGGVAATLQGPWMEEYQIPPWSNDYHFNINVQMIYTPCLASNRPTHLQPLWDLLQSWFPRLKECGERFFGRSGAMMLPHAVNDRCHVVGSFWTGTIDHACTGWMALMAWQHYQYTHDSAVLREVAWPLLNGAFHGYAAMLEEVEENGRKRWSLPVSVSPEYRGAGMNAWGRDASFQLACLHAVIEALERAAPLLGERRDPFWREVADRLPPYSTVLTADGGRRIALWEGTDLEESHRHHSHLASLYPFATVDPFDPAHHEVVAASLRHWVWTGAGAWTGWCVPWAAILCARCHLADAAVNWLHWGLRLFTNEGGGPLHNADFPGGSVIDNGALRTPDFRRPPHFREIMQMDAAMGFLSAVMELLVQSRRDGIHVLPSIPKGWREFAFDGIRTEGAFLVGATVERGVPVSIRVKSLAGGHLVLWHSLGSRWRVRGGVEEEGAVFRATMDPGEAMELIAIR